MIEITYELECLPENPNANVDAWIRAELKSGNEWAWCCAHVTAVIDIDGHAFTGHSYLGNCSYASEHDFLDSDYFADMKLEAKQALIENLIRAVKAGDVAARIIKQIS